MEFPQTKGKDTNQSAKLNPILHFRLRTGEEERRDGYV